jgi:hypothetical protein
MLSDGYILYQFKYHPEFRFGDVIFTFALTHPNTPLLATLLDLLGVDIARLF